MGIIMADTHPSERLIVVLRQTWKNVSLLYHLMSRTDEEQSWVMRLIHNTHISLQLKSVHYFSLNYSEVNGWHK